MFADLVRIVLILHLQLSLSVAIEETDPQEDAEVTSLNQRRPRLLVAEPPRHPHMDVRARHRHRLAAGGAQRAPDGVRRVFLHRAFRSILSCRARSPALAGPKLLVPSLAAGAGWTAGSPLMITLLTSAITVEFSRRLDANNHRPGLYAELEIKGHSPAGHADPERHEMAGTDFRVVGERFPIALTPHLRTTFLKCVRLGIDDHRALG